MKNYLGLAFMVISLSGCADLVALPLTAIDIAGFVATLGTVDLDTHSVVYDIAEGKDVKWEPKVIGGSRTRATISRGISQGAINSKMASGDYAAADMIRAQSEKQQAILSRQIKESEDLQTNDEMKSRMNELFKNKQSGSSYESMGQCLRQTKHDHDNGMTWFKNVCSFNIVVFKCSHGEGSTGCWEEEGRGEGKQAYMIREDEKSSTHYYDLDACLPGSSFDGNKCKWL